MIFPRLLDKNLKEIARLHPTSAMATLSLTPLSTASLVLPGDEDVKPEIRQFVELFGDRESLGIFRISEIRSEYGTSRTLSLEHAIATLDDSLTDEDETFSGGMKAIMQAILAHQNASHWQVGQVDDTKTDYSITASRSTCLQVLQEAAKQAENCYLAFDQSSYPWTVSLLRLPDGVKSECRITRNIEDVSIAFDDSSLCTRVYSSQLEGGHLDADTVSTWGVVSQAIQLDEKEEQAKNTEIAQKYLDENKNPAVSVTIGAIRLAEITGEPLDSFSLGDLCRVALPEWGVAMDERIITMGFSDLVGDPMRVRLTLSSKQDNASIALAMVAKTTRQLTRTVVEQHKHITETDQELLLHADRISAVAREINLKADSADVTVLGERVSQAEIDIDGVNAAITLKADQKEVTDLGTRLSSAEIKVDGANAQIILKADQKTVDEQGGRIAAAEIKIDGANGRIDAQAEEIALKADKIALEGYVTMEQFEALEGQVDNLWSDQLIVKSLSADNVTAGTGDFDELVFGTIAGKNATFRSKSVAVGISGVTQNKRYLNIRLADGGTAQLDIVTDVSVKLNYSTINYLGCDE